MDKTTNGQTSGNPREADQIGVVTERLSRLPDGSYVLRRIPDEDVMEFCQESLARLTLNEAQRWLRSRLAAGALPDTEVTQFHSQDCGSATNLNNGNQHQPKGRRKMKLPKDVERATELATAFDQ